MNIFLFLFCIPLLLIGFDPLSEMPPMREIYHPVSTDNREAQASFNRGLTYIFAYNHDIAFAEFEKASKLDPKLAMAFWGMALALGQNVNSDVTPENEIRCYNYIQQALQLASNASENEKAYIHALAVRYTNDPNKDLIPLRFTYREAMKKVKDAYPEDLDAQTIYSESLLELYPWKWWTTDGKPVDGTLEAIGVLETVLKKDPDHIGANHFYIHAMEESPYASRALLSAFRLETLLPEAGHLLHMPCHIFLPLGYYKDAIRTNLKAIQADRDYVKEVGLSGNYPLHYLSHNLNILVRTYILYGDYENAINTAFELNRFIEPYLNTHTNLASYTYVPFEVFLYFHKWDEILKFQPLAPNSDLVKAYQHFSRAMAFASLNDRNAFEKEKSLMLDTKKKLNQEEIANNSATIVFDLAELVLNATLARKEQKWDEAIKHLNQGIAIQDKLYYEEPPAWYSPLRQTLGAIQLEQKKFSDAEKTFSDALVTLARNPRLLYGLSQALKGQNKTIEAYWIDRELKNTSPFVIKFDDL